MSTGARKPKSIALPRYFLILKNVVSKISKIFKILNNLSTKTFYETLKIYAMHTQWFLVIKHIPQSQFQLQNMKKLKYAVFCFQQELKAYNQHLRVILIIGNN